MMIWRWLRLICEKILAENIDAASAMTTLMLVHGRDRCRRLEACCIEYMASHPDVHAAVVATKEYTELKEKCGPFLTDILEKVWMPALATRKHDSPPPLPPLPHHRHLFLPPHLLPLPLSPPPSSKTIPQKSASMINLSEVFTGSHEFRIADFSAAHKMFGVNNYIESSSFDVGVHKFTEVGIAKSYYVKYDGSLTVHCDVTVNKECAYTTSCSTAAARRIVPPSSNIACHLERLLASQECFDVKFQVRDSQICAHELVIAARSPTLHAAVSSAPHKDHVRIDDIDIPTFKAMLHFIYADELPPVSMLGKEATAVARDLLVAADRFGLDRMKAMCENLLCQLITTESVLATLELADRHGFQGLTDFFLDHISQPHVLKEAVETKSFKDLKTTSPRLLEEIILKISKVSSIDS
uniref:Uncharacterized protein n=1 Tax=Avena sativa TaxID=4498 RepID=A0ACD5WUR0_AVESA